MVRNKPKPRSYDRMKRYSTPDPKATRDESIWVGRQVKTLHESFKSDLDKGFTRSKMGSKQNIKYKKGSIKNANKLMRT